MERPILFSTKMVQAILKLIKRMTRRTKGLEKINKNPDKWNFDSISIDEQGLIAWFENNITYEHIGFKCPYGKPGDILWVRETWCQQDHMYFYKADNICTGCTEDGTCLPVGVEKHITCELCEYTDAYFKWKPSIHMPKAARRIRNTIINIRVERLHDITEEDAKAEGIELNYEASDERVCRFQNYKDAFKALWNDINGERGHGWDKNDWVWVIEFEKIGGEGNG